MIFSINVIVRRISIISCAMLLSGCAMPMPFQIASWALDGISYIVTEKSVTDHGISIVAQKDCALLRVVQGDDICSTYDDSGKIAIAKIGDADSADEIKLKGVGGETANIAAFAPTKTNPQLPESSTFNHVNVQPESAQNPRLLILGARVWSDHLDADMYYVVGSFSNRDNAQSLISKHSDLGPAILVSYLNGKKVYRVAVGPFKNYQRKDVKISIRNSGISNAWAMHIDHQKWRLSSQQDFSNTGKPFALAPESIKPTTKTTPSQKQAFVGEVAKIPMPKNKFSMNRWGSSSRQFSKT
jgi:hypothetical protein